MDTRGKGRERIRPFIILHFLRCLRNRCQPRWKIVLDESVLNSVLKFHDSTRRFSREIKRGCYARSTDSSAIRNRSSFCFTSSSSSSFSFSFFSILAKFSLARAEYMQKDGGSLFFIRGWKQWLYNLDLITKSVPIKEDVSKRISKTTYPLFLCARDFAIAKGWREVAWKFYDENFVINR